MFPEKKTWGELPMGQTASLYTFKNSKGMSVSISDYGGVIQSIIIPDKNGEPADVVLGYDTPMEYVNDTSTYFGAMVGRYANRISGSKFSIGGTEYKLTCNDGPNCLHGGGTMSHELWDAQRSCQGLTLRNYSPDGADGFPGTMRTTINIDFSEDGVLSIEYIAMCEKDCYVNLTNHAYFNLAGKGDILRHEVMINSDKITETDDALIPTGKFIPVEGTKYDFRTPKAVGEAVYDDNFVLSSGDVCATVYDPESGRKMTVTTDLPGVQLYTASALGETKGKGGAVYGKGSGLCLETQYFPDTPNRPEFPSCLVKKGDFFHSVTKFKFE